MRYLSLDEVLDLHRRVIKQSGGAEGIADRGLLESAVAQPRMAFAGQEAYATVIEKAAALGFSLIMNHPFLDGNKRIGHAAMETFLVLNGYELTAPADEQERTILKLAASEMARDEFFAWVSAHTRVRSTQAEEKP